jgi:hypothetical protein
VNLYWFVGKSLKRQHEPCLRKKCFSVGKQEEQERGQQ